MHTPPPTYKNGHAPASQSSAFDLRAALGQPDEILEMGGTKIEIRSIRIADIPAFIDAAEPVLKNIDAFFSNDDRDWKELLRRDVAASIVPAAIALRIPREWIGELHLGQLLELWEAIIRVNSEMFAKSVAPRFASILEVINMRVGAIPSPNLSERDTTSPPLPISRLDNSSPIETLSSAPNGASAPIDSHSGP